MDRNEHEVPTLPPCLLEKSPNPLQLQRKWRIPFPDAVGLCVGDWNSDGISEILVSDKTNTIHILNLEGNEIGSFQAPQEADLLEIGQTQDGPVLVVYKNWGKQVAVLDRNGEQLWGYPRKFQFKSGINGASWGDIDGDGNDELVVGLNAFGVRVLTHRGKTLWRNWGLENRTDRSVISATVARSGCVYLEGIGRIHSFDFRGKKIGGFKPPEKQYILPISAGVMDQLDAIQVASIAWKLEQGERIPYDWMPQMVFGFDSIGNVIWKTPAWTWYAAWRSPQFALGDIDGDGRNEWAFMRDFYELVFCNQEGVRVATLDLQRRPDRFAIISSSESGIGQGLIVLKDEIGVECWGPLTTQNPNLFESSSWEEALDSDIGDRELVSVL